MSRVWLLALSLLLLPSCSNDPTYAFVESFEEVCDGVPCGWQLQAGSTGSATYNETLPGEHGLLLSGGPMAILRDLPGVELASNSYTTDAIVVDVAARCPDFDALTFEVTVELLASGELEVLTGTVSPSGSWDGTLDVVGLTSASGGFGELFGDVVSIRILKTTTGTCELDYVALRMQSFLFEG